MVLTALNTRAWGTIIHGFIGEGGTQAQPVQSVKGSGSIRETYLEALGKSTTVLALTVQLVPPLVLTNLEVPREVSNREKPMNGAGGTRGASEPSAHYSLWHDFTQWSLWKGKATSMQRCPLGI